MSTATIVEIVGNAGVGKKTLASALGWQSASSCDDRIVGILSIASMDVSLHITRQVQHMNHYATIALVLFDLTNRESFVSAIVQWSMKIQRSPSSHVLLIGTKADCQDRRQVLYDEANEVAAMDFDGYVEVTKDDYTVVQQHLARWLGIGDQSRMPEEYDATVHALSLPEPEAPPAPQHVIHQRLRTSIWLYDPSEDLFTASHEARLRPVAKALHAMRSSVKERRNEQPRQMPPSRYYGPTQSSRLGQWNKADTTTKRPKVLRKLSDPTKSFLQPTELTKQRQRTKTITTTAVQAKNNQHQHEKPMKHKPNSPQKPVTSQPESPQMPLKSLPKSPNSPQKSLKSLPKSPQKKKSPPLIRHVSPIEIPTTSHSEEAIDLLSPGADQSNASLPAPLPLAHLQSPIPPVPLFTSFARESLVKPQPLSDIDDMLDYFDNITLPL